MNNETEFERQFVGTPFEGFSVEEFREALFEYTKSAPIAEFVRFYSFFLFLKADDKPIHFN